jgi:hypothetical protein
MNGRKGRTPPRRYGCAAWAVPPAAGGFQSTRTTRG